MARDSPLVSAVGPRTDCVPGIYMPSLVRSGPVSRARSCRLCLDPTRGVCLSVRPTERRDRHTGQTAPSCRLSRSRGPSRPLPPTRQRLTVTCPAAQARPATVIVAPMLACPPHTRSPSTHTHTHTLSHKIREAGGGGARRREWASGSRPGTRRGRRRAAATRSLATQHNHKTPKRVSDCSSFAVEEFES